MSKKALLSHFPHIIPYMFFDVLGIEEKIFDKNATMSVYWRFFLMADLNLQKA
jgi:hypothetical protein